jgi:hypothetical protein
LQKIENKNRKQQISKKKKRREIRKEKKAAGSISAWSQNQPTAHLG